MISPPSSAESATAVAVALAIDIGGTKVEAALVDTRGHLIAQSRKRASTGRDTTADALRAALKTTATAALSALPADAILVGAGIGSAGPIDRRAGTAAPLNMPHVHGFRVQEYVASLLPEGTRVELGLDGMCIALAEWQIGAGRGADNLLCMVVSTGIGGGLVCDGIPVVGADGNAGHIGQLRVREWTGSPTTTRHAGTLESIASGPASVAWARAQGWSGTSGEDLSRDAAAGHEVARRAVVRSANAVGEALAGFSALTSTPLVIIGGGFARVSPDYLDLVQSRAREVAVLPSAQQLSVVAPQLGDTAPLVGAALLVLDVAHGEIRSH